MANLESSASTACSFRRRRMMYLRQPCEATGHSLAHSLGRTWTARFTEYTLAVVGQSTSLQSIVLRSDCHRPDKCFD